jgi:hypothetical protein
VKAEVTGRKWDFIGEASTGSLKFIRVPISFTEGATILSGVPIEFRIIMCLGTGPR